MKSKAKARKPVKITQLIKSGRLSPMSPITLISEKLGINWLMMFDDEYVYGPTPGITEAADLLITHLKPKTVIDLFGGSGALSKLAVKKGVKKVVYVDLYPEAAVLNLKKQKGIQIIKDDVFDFLERDVRCDLLIADPPEDLIDEVLRRTKNIRRIIRKAALIWLGAYPPAKKRMHKTRTTTVIEAWGDSFAVLWKPGYSEKIRDIKKRLE